jgi:Fe-S-cluster-containing dehydrogenase component/DMSO reductase anchor subunit
MLEHYLREQKTLTAVDRFSRHHDEGTSGVRLYEDLLPPSKPAKGQQYAFRVDLDACTGCKACVTACHNLNGLDDGETWRAVGLLHGGTADAPVKQTVTTACHHCVDPACMKGCPVGAYEKDSETGIVKHLDDQCIGCQYCTFTCPYEVPQFNAKLGIVRKCDMCTDRLAEGEAPACVQGCPNEAISITIVDTRQAVDDAQSDAFLPGAPSPALTIPTTVYETKRALPRNLLPGNFYTVTPAHRHYPLVLMLVLTQLSVGAFIVDTIASRFLPDAARAFQSLAALAVALIALGTSVPHLGRPLYAFRAIIGLRTSWMSREIVAFGLFAPLAIAYAASSWFGRIAPSFVVPRQLQEALGIAVAFVGFVGVCCSVGIYHATKRAWWTAHLTGFKFFMTTSVLGLGATIVALRAGAGPEPVIATLSKLLIAASLLKAAGELSIFAHLRERRYTELKRTAVLMAEDLGTYTAVRFVAIALGGIVFPALGSGVVCAAISLVLLVVGELLERTLFFAASSSPGMPGALR